MKIQREKSEQSHHNNNDREMLFNNQYMTKKKISAGSFGTVYSGIDMISNEIVAIKIEKIEDEDGRSLVREAQMLSKLQGIRGVPKLYWHGAKGQNDALVISLLGKDLGSLMKTHKKLSLKTVILLADQLLAILEEVHAKNIVHRDLKPENILIGRGEDAGLVYIVDFGISKFYKDSNGRHVPYRDKKSFIGTTRYASIAAHMGVEIARKDDMESLFYVLLYLLKGQLQWQSLNISEREKTKKVGEIKNKLTPEELCKDLPEEFVQYMNHVRNLTFKQAPDYTFLKELIKRVAVNKKIDFDYHFEWGTFAPKLEAPKTTKPAAKPIGEKRFSLLITSKENEIYDNLKDNDKHNNENSLVRGNNSSRLEVNSFNLGGSKLNQDFVKGSIPRIDSQLDNTLLKPPSNCQSPRSNGSSYNSKGNSFILSTKLFYEESCDNQEESRKKVEDEVEDDESREFTEHHSMSQRMTDLELKKLKILVKKF